MRRGRKFGFSGDGAFALAVIAAGTLSAVSTALGAADLVLNASGAHGASGHNGAYWGASGTGGESGTSAQSIDLDLRDEGDSLRVSGRVGSRVVSESLSARGQWLRLLANGGRGGAGGDGHSGQPGQDGSPGYDGRDGHWGRSGRDGRHGTRYSPNGENGEHGWPGGDGQDGGDGGDGTDGGDGGNGGRGGNGGAGGEVVVRYQDPAVLMHLSMEFFGGRAGGGGSLGLGGAGGNGGRAGRGGDGGWGGSGGDGGRGYRCSETERAQGCHNGTDGRDGWRGREGTDGRSGQRGSDGSHGHAGYDGGNGVAGAMGAVRLQQVDADGRVIHEHASPNIYKLRVEAFDVIDANEDGIFEPGESFTVRGVRVRNIGAMDMPAGGEIAFAGVEGALGALPALPRGAVHAVAGELHGRIAADAPVGRELTLEPAASFRGLDFGADDFGRRLVAQRPLVVEGIAHREYVAREARHVALVRVRNISSKPYVGTLSYEMQGGFVMAVRRPLGSVAAGAGGVEEVEYFAPERLRAFDRAELAVTLSRSGTAYSRHALALQAVPVYQPAADAAGLVVSTGFTAEAYEQVVARLGEIGFAFDVFDLNLNGKIGAEVLDRYRGKVVFMPLMRALDAESLEALRKFAQVEGGTVAYGIAPDRGLRPASYQHQTRESEADFFRLDPRAQAQAVENGVLDVLPFESKLRLLLAHYESGAAELRAKFTRVIVDDIREEYLESVKNEFVYRDFRSWLQQYAELALSLNPVSQFQLRAFVLGFVPLVDKFDDQIEGGAKVAYRNRLEAPQKAWDDLSRMGGTCGKITGTYRSATGGRLLVWEAAWLDTRAKLDNPAMGFQVKAVEEMGWRFRYSHAGRSQNVVFRMTCDGAYVAIEAEMPHSGEKWLFVKTER